MSVAFIMFGGGLAFLLAIVQLFQKRFRFRNILLAVIFISIAIIQVQGCVVYTSHMTVESAGMMILLLAKFIMGPSIYFFYMSLFNRDFNFRVKSFVHFIPLAVVLVLYFVFLVTNGLSGEFSVIFNRFIRNNLVFEYLHILGFAQILGYLLSVFLKFDVIKVLRDSSRDRMTVISITVITILSLILIMIIVSMITDMQFFARTAMMLMSFFVIYWFIMSQIHPEIFFPFHRRPRNTVRIDTLLNGIDIDRLESGIASLFSREKIFCDEDLSLKRLAGLLDIQPQELSVYLNHHLKINFNAFLNGYRIEEAVSLMKENPERSILSVAFSVGFNSKSVFYDAFIKHTGVSPARYRRENILKKVSPE